MILRLRFECRRSGIDVRRVNIYFDGVDGGFHGNKGLIGGFANFIVDLRFQILNLFLIE